MEFKGTKGEWKAKKNPVFWEVNCDSKNKILRIHVMQYSKDIKNDFHHGLENEYNAKLIAAAPDLLNALKVYLNAGCKEQRRKASVIAKKAIKKALEP